ncbi:linear amide C-N hydrolase [Alcaligenes nematophilus]|uniref:Linear amide C-N hydrolase n=1 Tax=Alcaligenes nematophilus TaxID=2994643 RepID=A0ABU3MQD6_9BURK|nr:MULTISPECIES: linear amide C-N hydrolase [Alcaligenes]MDK7585009.1 linear amide C-N hydrolase [Alcaligenes phenolicus]MDT8463709.1 linear amide C-N hydrolase [Alcaligenes nematophilus]MDT8467522.1 linear amide C-N hydrolase [Alcaligenes nematophilus]MDT8503999.1 linear amide C-N hydrolase [Alcaligenes nematophilus]MDT8523881.1 linear amide C-N hydrolase [Alcaligenes nematophilus]
MLLKKCRRTLLACAVGLALVPAASQACTRAVFLGDNGQVITGRSMDWKLDVGTNLWIFPRGEKRTGEAGPSSIEWTSKYGSVIASGYDLASTDGANEKGLNVNLLWLVESQYPTPQKGDKTLSMSLWGQYVLDNFATVAEAVAALEKNPFVVISDKVPNEERLATLHLSMSDSSGDSAIIEYIDGKQHIHHSRKYQVLTNSPTFDQQLAIRDYWQSVGGMNMLPGTSRAADRFARASFYIDAVPRNLSDDKAVASVLSVMRNASTPYGMTVPDQPNNSSTRWRTVFDHQRSLYYFDSVLSPGAFWVDMRKVDFSAETGKVMKLDLGPEQSTVYMGEALEHFKPAKPFQFLPAKAPAI